jgi:opacity protein-like surface antigen
MTSSKQVSRGASRRLSRSGLEAAEVLIWVGIVAARISYMFAERWSVRLYGDIGAGDSEQTWQVWANLAYTLSDRTTILAGYRHLDYDLEDGATDIDLSFTGPQAGVVFTF